MKSAVVYFDINAIGGVAPENELAAIQHRTNRMTSVRYHRNLFELRIQDTTINKPMSVIGHAKTKRTRKEILVEAHCAAVSNFHS
jgi:hypothetical protein